MVNLVNAVERGVLDGTVETNTETFIFKDNFLTEHAFYRETSESPDLCAIVLHLRVLFAEGMHFL
jgi:hypothetical protein